MRKIVIHRSGGFNRLKIESCPDPFPGDSQVVVGGCRHGVAPSGSLLKVREVEMKDHLSNIIIFVLN